MRVTTSWNRSGYLLLATFASRAACRCRCSLVRLVVMTFPCIGPNSFDMISPIIAKINLRRRDSANEQKYTRILTNHGKLHVMAKHHFPNNGQHRL
ncbi:uncharacterized protein BDZ99DRAFT_81633 [Mytilinidion resinicola]|uniref:Uncharacterized protein n=1 Tax=Mytilinidion resinicola TaxID=574789 RepID=A0A6A6YFE7_9PEZI|nr:uncharacterized protein BDZ99DRAFT_81633 [Mytilinidion resinicola]KAF2806597.1 hypothetical protein BDZ99DRAFT_81633 [Mytilinidion resinicola]